MSEIKETKLQAAYVAEATGTKRCRVCEFFHPGVSSGTCDKVMGVISPSATCKRWEAIKP